MPVLDRAARRNLTDSNRAVLHGFRGAAKRRPGVVTVMARGDEYS